jgi:pimeloyl-ACP methyl ester carboxylesterase
MRAIMDAIGSRRAVLFGFSEGCPMSVLFAATHPSRVSHLILFAGFARDADRIPDEVWPTHVEDIIRNWGVGKMIKALIPSQVVNPEAIAQFAKFERLSSSPGL